jgi:hypothetical protein
MQVSNSIGPAYGTHRDRRLVTPGIGSTHGPTTRSGHITCRSRRPLPPRRCLRPTHGEPRDIHPAIRLISIEP